jgi:6-phosphogluconolactonase
MTKRILSVLLGVALIAGCGDSDDNVVKKDGGDARGPDVTKVPDAPFGPEVAVPDTKVPDAAPDAPLPDANLTEAGKPDVSITEAGATEAGATEAGKPDTKVTEAGATEAGATEAGQGGPLQMVYVGCKGSTDSPADLRIFAMNPANGDLTVAGSYNPGSALSFPAVHPNHKYLYVTKSAEDKVISLAIDQKTGLLSDNGASEVIVGDAFGVDGGVADGGITGAANPVYATIDSTGTWLIATTYAGNNVNVFKLGTDGKVGALVAKRSGGIHAHSALLTSANNFLFVPYHGSDIIAQYYFDPKTGAIKPNETFTVSVGAGEGPRHLDMHPNGRYVYLVTETLANVKTYSFDSVARNLVELQSLPATQPTYTGKKFAADIHVVKAGPMAGKVLYVSNREEQSLVAYTISDKDYKLTELQHVDLLPNRTPRNFNIDESGKFLLESNQDSANIATYAIDQTNGKLTKLKDYPVCALPYFVLNVSVPKGGAVLDK